MDQAYTAAHEGTATDASQLLSTEDLAQLVFAPDPETAEPRWVVFPSADKAMPWGARPTSNRKTSIAVYAMLMAISRLPSSVVNK